MDNTNRIAVIILTVYNQIPFDVVRPLALALPSAQQDHNTYTRRTTPCKLNVWMIGNRLTC